MPKPPNIPINKIKQKILKHESPNSKALESPHPEMGVYEITIDPTKRWLPHVPMKTSASKSSLSLLVDSGSAISLLKSSCISEHQKLTNESIDIKGIDPDKECTSTLGHFELQLNLPKNTYIRHKFHVAENINLPYDGIIGSDLLKRFRCNINYSRDMLEIGNLNIKLQFVEPTYLIPPRTEMIIECSVQNPEIKEGLVVDYHHFEDLLFPNSILKVKNNNRANISVINISEKPVTLNSNLNLTLIPMKSFNVSYPVNNIMPENDFNNSPDNNINNSYERAQTILNLLRSSHLNREEKGALQEVCSNYADIFHLPGDKLSFTTATSHNIPTTSSVPINTKSYRFPECHKAEVASQINKMLDEGIIKPSSSPWSSPIWVVPKKLDVSGQRKWRVVIDYRKLNDITIGDAYPIPQISEILDQLGSCKYFSTLDLASGFHQICVNETDTAKTAFTVPDGHFEFTRMPFGLKNAPSTFQRLMNTVLTGLQGMRCFVYLDDIVIYSHDLPSHIENLEAVFQKLRDNNLKLQPDKCEFLRTEVAYLGHIIGEDGVKPNPEKVKAVTEFPIPKNAKDIKSFLGLVSYYRRFIPEFSKIAKPLTTLLKKDIPFKWENQQQLAFDHLKHKLTSAPVLCYPDFTKPFTLTCDASNYAISAILSQGSTGQERPIAYASRTLNKSESNYSTTEKELLAILFGCKTFRPYLYGRKFQIVTDHRPLKWLMNHRDPSSKLQRWRLKLEEYEYEIVYRKGKLNSAADALSRFPVNPIYPEIPNINNPESNITSSNENPAQQIEEHPDSLEQELIELQDLLSPSDLIQPSGLMSLPDLRPDATNSDVTDDIFRYLESNPIENPIAQQSNNPTSHSPEFVPPDNYVLPETQQENPTSDANLEQRENQPLTSFDAQVPNLSVSNSDTEIPSNAQSPSDEETYSKFLKNKEIHNTVITEHNETLSKSSQKLIIVPTSLDLDESMPFVSEILNEYENQNEFRLSERPLHSAQKLCIGNKIYYFLYTKVHHFDNCTYADIFDSLKAAKNNIIKENPDVKELSITDFQNPFEKLIFAKIYNMLAFLFRDTGITIHVYHNKIIYPTLSEIPKILRENHDIPIAGHLGTTRMLNRIREVFYWKSMRSDVENYVKNCSLCQTNKALRRVNRAPMIMTSTSTAPFQRVALDIVGPLPEAGTAQLKYILTLQDDLTKYSVAYPIRSVCAEESTDCLVHFISLFGIPQNVLSDQGTNFTADLFKKTCDFLKIKQLWSTPYHPQTQGALERSHSTLKEYLKSFINKNQDNWPRYVYTAMLAYNTTVHSTTNYTPYELVFGHKPFLPNSLYNESPSTTYPDYVKMLQHRLKCSHDKALEHIQKSKTISKQYYDSRTRPVQYKENDLVYLKNHLRLRKALSPLWKGPYKIIKVHDNHTATLLINRRHVRHHFDEMKLAEINLDPP